MKHQTRLGYRKGNHRCPLPSPYLWQIPLNNLVKYFRFTFCRLQWVGFPLFYYCQGLFLVDREAKWWSISNFYSYSLLKDKTCVLLKWIPVTASLWKGRRKIMLPRKIPITHADDVFLVECLMLAGNSSSWSSSNFMCFYNFPSDIHISKYHEAMLWH